MKRLLVACLVAAAALAHAGPSAAQDSDANADSPFAVGVYVGLGMAHSFYSRYDPGPRFAGGGGVHFDFRLSRAFAFDIGIDLTDKGCLLNAVDYRLRFLVLEIPIGVKITRAGIVLGIALAFDVGLYNERKHIGGADSYWTDDIDNWDEWNRFNLSPRLTLGYRIPVGRFAIVPGVAWSIDVLNTVENPHQDWSLHNMNLMATLGVELDLGVRKAPAAGPSPTAAPKRRFDRFALGAYASLGTAFHLAKNDSEIGFDWYSDELEPRFVGGGGAYLDLYLSRWFALDFGIGFIGKGYTRKADDMELRLLYLEIPLGVTLDLWGVRIGAAMAVDVAISGAREWTDEENSHYEWPWEDYEWSLYRRVNFGPRLSLGYAFRAWRIAIVPGVSWSMDILDNALIDRGDFQLRNMNVMFNLGVEYGFGG